MWPPLPTDAGGLFHDRFGPKRWERIRKAIDTPGLKLHDLRKTCASLLAPKVVFAAVTQRLLEHSSLELHTPCTKCCVIAMISQPQPCALSEVGDATFWNRQPASCDPTYWWPVALRMSRFSARLTAPVLHSDERRFERHCGPKEPKYESRCSGT